MTDNAAGWFAHLRRVLHGEEDAVSVPDNEYERVVVFRAPVAADDDGAA